MRVTVHLDSRDRLDGTPAAYRLPLPHTLKGVRRYRVLSAEVAGTIDQIAGGNAAIDLRVNGAPAVTCEIPSGTYSAAAMASALQGALQGAVSAYTWSVSISETTRRARIGTAEGASIAVTGGGLAALLGLPTGAAATVIDGERPVTLRPYAYILVESEELRGAFAGGAAGPSTCLTKLVLESPTDGAGPWMDCLPPLASLDTLRIRARVYDDASTIPDHSFTLELELSEPAAPASPPTRPTPTGPGPVRYARPLPPRLPQPPASSARLAAPGPDSPTHGYGTVMKQAGCAAAALAAVWTAFM